MKNALDDLGILAIHQKINRESSQYTYTIIDTPNTEKQENSDQINSKVITIETSHTQTT